MSKPGKRKGASSRHPKPQSPIPKSDAIPEKKPQYLANPEVSTRIPTVNLIASRSWVVKWLKRSSIVIAVLGFLVTAAGFVVKVEHDREVQIHDQEAFLTPIGLNLPTRTELYVARVGLLNNGNTPAYGVGGRISLSVGLGKTTLLEPTFDAAAYQSHHLVDIPAKTGEWHSQALVPEGSESERLAFQSELLDGVAAGQKNLWIFGGANYTTEFGDRGWVTYCYRLQENLKQVDTCSGDRNRSRIIAKSWFQTLISALPGWTPPRT